MQSIWGTIKMAQLTAPGVLKGEFREEETFLLCYVVSSF